MHLSGRSTGPARRLPWPAFAVSPTRTPLVTFAGTALAAFAWTVPVALAGAGAVPFAPSLAHAQPAGSPAATEPVQVFASILPQAGVVEAIGGDLVRVDVLVKPGQEPHTYEPGPRQIAALGQARIFFTIGMPFERRLMELIRSTYRDLVVVDMAAGIAQRRYGEETGIEEGIGAPEESELLREQSATSRETGFEALTGAPDETADPHVWLSPALLQVLARNAAEALSAADPSHREIYLRNLESFASRTQSIDRRITEQLAPYRGRSLFVFHPSFGYFSDHYGLTQVAIEIEGKEPTPRQLASTIERARAEGVKTIFAEPEFDVKLAETVARAIGARVILLDPLASDLPNNLERIAARIAAAWE